MSESRSMIFIHVDTDLPSEGTPLSMGAVTPEGHSFHAEFKDFDYDSLSDRSKFIVSQFSLFVPDERPIEAHFIQREKDNASRVSTSNGKLNIIVLGDTPYIISQFQDWVEKITSGYYRTVLITNAVDLVLKYTQMKRPPHSRVLYQPKVSKVSRIDRDDILDSKYFDGGREPEPTEGYNSLTEARNMSRIYELLKNAPKEIGEVETVDPEEYMRGFDVGRRIHLLAQNDTSSGRDRSEAVVIGRYDGFLNIEIVNRFPKWSVAGVMRTLHVPYDAIIVGYDDTYRYLPLTRDGEPIYATVDEETGDWKLTDSTEADYKDSVANRLTHVYRRNAEAKRRETFEQNRKIVVICAVTTIIITGIIMGAIQLLN